MKKHLRFFALLLVVVTLLPTFVLAGESADIIKAQYKKIEGDDFVIDTIDGVPAYPNYQCNDLAIRYYDEVFDVDMFVGIYSPFLTENYYLMRDADIDDIGDIPDSISGFTHATEPKRGDIVYWSATRRNKSYAHTALVKSYSKGVITLIEQNWNWNGQAVYERQIKWPSENYVVYTLADEYKNRPYAEESRVQVDIDNGMTRVTFPAYALLDENGYPTNYVKLRDVAYAMNFSGAPFNVDWDGDTNSILVETYTYYTTLNGTELSMPFSGRQPYKQNANRIIVDGRQVSLDAIVLTDSDRGEHTYFKLRDLGRELSFDVSWSNELNKIIIDTSIPYDPNT